MLNRTPTSYFSRMYLALIAVASVLILPAAHAWAQGMDEDSGDGEPDVPMAEEAPIDPDAVRHGVGLRLRYVFVPKGLIQIFMEEAAGGMAKPGFGLDYIRRKNNFEFSVGFEYDSLSGTEGYYIENGGSTQENGTVDLVEFDGLSWFTIDASFVYHHPLTEMVSLRYGGGIGLGIVTGDVITSDATCTGTNTQNDCTPQGPGGGGDFEKKEDFFRVPPVFNLIAGVQITPVRNMAINLEIGMRTLFYSGISGQYFF